jgi:Family of unknown function (DUF6510)
VDDAPLDGNAAAGILGEVFVAEMTVATTICSTCGAVAQVGQLRAYLRAPGTVLRCAACGAVQIRVVRGPDRAWLDLRGVRVLEVGLDST